MSRLILTVLVCFFATVAFAQEPVPLVTKQQVEDGTVKIELTTTGETKRPNENLSSFFDGQIRGTMVTGNVPLKLMPESSATIAIQEAEQEARDLIPTRNMLDRVGETLTRTDQLFHGYSPLLEFPRYSRNLHNDQVQNEHIGQEVRDWVALAQAYFDAQARFRSRKFRGFFLYDQLVSMEQWARQNQEAVQTVIDQRLAEVRRPLRVAFVTPNRNDVEHNLLYSWALEQWHVTWITANAQDELTDAAGKAFVPANHDVIWIHQVRYSQLPAEGKLVDAQTTLMPALTKQETVRAMRVYLSQGGGLLLSGIAGLYVMPLELETTLPNKLRESSYYPMPFTSGLIAAPGFAQHPLFMDLPAVEGFYTNANYPEQNLVPECAWSKQRPTGLILAHELDQVYGRTGDYAAGVEYPAPPGKVIAIGGRPCDLSPGHSFTLPAPESYHTNLRARMLQVVINAFGYLASDEQFKPDKAAMAVVTEKADRDFLPLDGWLFRLDPQNVGMQQGWYQPNVDTADWQPILIGVNWESQGYEYDGYAWYRRSFTAANKPGKRTMLELAAVDHTAIVFIDGKEVGKFDEGLDGWNKPFAFDITAFLADAPQEHLLAVQVLDSAAAGGIWRPISLAYQDK